MQLKTIVRSQTGFSLVEIMVAAGMLGIISFGVMSLMENMTKGQKSLAQNHERMQLVNRVTLAMRNRDACRRTLAAGTGLTVACTPGVDCNANRVNPTGTNAAPATVITAPANFTIYDSGGSPIITLGQIYGDSTGGRLQFFRFEMYNHPATLTDGLQAQPATMRLTFRKQGANSFYGGIDTNDEVTVDSVIDGTQQMVDCYTSENAFIQQACDALNGSMGGAQCQNLIVGDRGSDAPNPDDPAPGQNSQNAIITNGSIRINPSSLGGANVAGLGINTAASRNGSIDMTGSIGVGTAAPATVGTIHTSNSLSVGAGAPVPAAGGNLEVFGNTRTQGTTTSDQLIIANNFIDIRDSNPAKAAGAQFLRVGDDSFLTDVDVANTLGVFGVQNSTTATIQIGNQTNQTVTGINGVISINNNNPTTLSSTRLDVNGAVHWGGIAPAAGPGAHSYLTTAGGGSIELGGNGNPYIDFKTTLNDRDARLQLAGIDTLRITGANLEVTADAAHGGDGVDGTIYSKVASELFVRNLLFTDIDPDKWDDLMKQLMASLTGIALGQEDTLDAIMHYVCKRMRIVRGVPSGTTSEYDTLSYVQAAIDGINDDYCQFTDYYNDFRPYSSPSLDGSTTTCADTPAGTFCCPDQTYLYAYSLTKFRCKQWPNGSEAAGAFSAGTNWTSEACSYLTADKEGKVKCAEKYWFASGGFAGTCGADSTCSGYGDPTTTPPACPTNWKETGYQASACLDSLGNGADANQTVVIWSTGTGADVTPLIHVGGLNRMAFGGGVSCTCGDACKFFKGRWRRCARYAWDMNNN